jgi:acyl carrier protein
MAMSESDLHQLFAEAIVAGRSDKCDPELVAGVSVLRGREQVEKAFWARNARLGMMIKDEIGAGEGMDGNSTSSAATIPVRKLLEAAKTVEDTQRIILGALKARLQAAKFLPDADTLHDRTPLADLGVDSLMAVEIRSWFQKELAVDVPVMKILGGASMADLVDGVTEKVSQQAIPAKPNGHVSAKELRDGVGIAPLEQGRIQERKKGPEPGRQPQESSGDGVVMTGSMSL